MDQIAKWQEHRVRSFNALFSRCPRKLFPMTLELGADYGFQSTLLAEYTSHLTSTDVKRSILQQCGDEMTTFLRCDVEKEIDRMFSPNQFDLVFSSNVLEHLHEPVQVLKNIYRVVKDDGITINVMPGPFFVVIHSLLHLPEKVITRLRGERRKTNAQSSAVEYARTVADWLDQRGMLRNREKFITDFTASSKESMTQTENMRHRRQFCRAIREILLQRPHGVSTSLIDELQVFSRASWMKRFAEAHLDVVRVIKMPIPRALNGLNLGPVNQICERVGLATEYAYVATKQGSSSPYARYFGC